MQLKSFDDIQRVHRHIFLSPHFDDVVYSCGGTLGVQASAGLRPLVITVFGGAPTTPVEFSPFALETHRKMGFRQDAQAAIATRRREDAAALDYLHADYLWLDYPDAMYRGTPPHYPNRVVGVDVHPGDLWIDRELAQNLVALHDRLPDAVRYAPLAIGPHVDHQIVCSAADRLTELGANVKLYEDFPYVLDNGAREKRIKDFGGSLEPALVEMSEMLPLRQEAAAMYASQIDANFGNKEVMFNAMQTYTYSIRPVHTVHLERYWTLS